MRGKIGFGLIWTVFTSFMIFMFYGNTGGTLTVNGQVVSQEEFNAMLFPKIFFGIFLLVGISFLIIGIKEAIQKTMAKTSGEYSYGVILDTWKSHNGTQPNALWLSVLAITNKGTTIKNQKINNQQGQYKMGTYVKIKYYGSDFVIIKPISREEVPFEALEQIGENAIARYGLDIEENLDNIGDSKQAVVMNGDMFNENKNRRKTIIINGKEFVEK